MHPASASPFKPLPPREAGVCRRAAEARQAAGIGQRDFATLIGLTRNQLANIESARVPLRYSVAKRICQQLNLAQSWLAEGAGPMRGYVRIIEEDEASIGLSALFTSAYDNALKSEARRAVTESLSDEKVKAWMRATGKSEGDSYAHYIETLGKFFKLIPASLRPDFFGQVMALSAEFLRSKNLVRANDTRATRSATKVMLEKQAGPEHNGDMAKLDDWIKRLRKVCETRGAMSRVARALKVSPQAVAQWLSTDPEVRTWPSGELVLPLIAWVESEEAQQKSPVEGATSTERTTTRRKARHEDQTSGRKKS